MSGRVWGEVMRDRPRATTLTAAVAASQVGSDKSRLGLRALTLGSGGEWCEPPKYFLHSTTLGGRVSAPQTLVPSSPTVEGPREEVERRPPELCARICPLMLGIRQARLLQPAFLALSAMLVRYTVFR